VKGQLIDNFGLKTGPGLSNLYWKYNRDEFSDLSGWRDNKIGFSGQVFAEKSMFKYFSLRAAAGYIQKGFKNDIKFTIENGEELKVKKPDVLLHQLSFDISLKINLMQKDFTPYILAGLRGDYLLDYRTVIIDFYGNDLEVDKELYDDFKKFTLDGVFGAGITFRNIMFLEMEYNPGITNNFKSEMIAIRGNYFGLTAGMNIQHLIGNKKK
jgi:hypothetical protein